MDFIVDLIYSMMLKYSELVILSRVDDLPAGNGRGASIDRASRLALSDRFSISLELPPGKGDGREIGDRRKLDTGCPKSYPHW